MDELSVIVPVHNAQRFLPTAFATMRQNHRDGIRFIVVDDHSDDDSPRMIEAVQAEMPYITAIRNPANFGVARSRNIALEHVESRYLTYFDVDDWFRPGHLPDLIEAIRQLQTDMVRIDHVLSVGYERTLVRAPETDRARAVDSRAGIGVPGTRSMVDYPYLWAGIYDLTKIDRSLFAFHEHLRTAADRPWFWRMHLQTSSYAVADQRAGYFYRKDPNARALTQGGNENTLHFADAHELILDLAFDSGVPSYIAKAAYSALHIVEFHIARRARLNEALQSRLFARSAVLLSRLTPDQFAHAAEHFDRTARTQLERLYRHGTQARERFGRETAT